VSRFASRHIATAASLGAIAVVVVLTTTTGTGRNVVDAIFNGDTRELRHQLLGLGVGGVVVLLAVCLSHAILPFPTEIVTAAAGFVYGFWLALPILLVCWLASALLAYWLAERFGRPLARRLVGARRLQRAEDVMEMGGAATLLSLRLIPLIPYNAICYAAGITRVPLVRYSWTTIVGITPLTVLVAYLGSRLKSPDFGDWRVWVLIVAFIAIVVGGQVVERRLRYRRAASEENG
jgi:uncharacterized membrane protein YdjX (TVP38/TMEM64 family)